jgi:hypothetical protein
MAAVITRGAAISGSALWTPAGATRDGWIVNAKHTNITSAGTTPLWKNTYVAANQPQNDLVEVLSSDALDITQTVTVYGIDRNGNRVSEAIALNTTDGTTVVAGTTYFDYVESARLSAACVGTVTVQEASGNADISTITIGDLVMYIGHLFTGHLTGYLAYVNAEVLSVAGNVTIDILWYPNDASCVALTGFEIIDTFTILDTEGLIPHAHTYPVMKRLDPGGYLTARAIGEGGNDEDVSITLMGFWDP